MASTIDLVFFEGCPNVEAARAELQQALSAAGKATGWREWRSDDPEIPAYARGFGSPTILVDGRDVAGAEPGASATACRVYADLGGSLRGAPSADRIADALRGATPR